MPTEPTLFMVIPVGIFIIAIVIMITMAMVIGKNKPNSPPVVITSVTHETAGPNATGQMAQPVSGYVAATQLPGHQPYPMPQPQSGGYPPMPQPMGAIYPPYPQAQPSGVMPPYPPRGHVAPYPAMYPSDPAAGAGPHGPPVHMNPPSYEQVLNAEQYQKQSPYNPNFGGQ